MADNGNAQSFFSAHPILSGLLFTLMLMPGVYFATGAHEKGSPTVLQMALIVVVVGPVIGFLLKFLADRRDS